MPVVPQAANSGVTSPLFGGPVASPHAPSARPASSRIALPHIHSGDLQPLGSEACRSSPPGGAACGGQRSSDLDPPKTPIPPRQSVTPATASPKPETKTPSKSRKPLHRLAEVRVQQGISERTMARRLGIDLKSYREMEDPHFDLTVSQLTKLQEALDVPIADLLEDHHALSRPVHERAKLLKVMKTAVAMREAKINPRTDRMAQMLCEQLIDLMPELAEVSGWPQFGARRGLSAIGKTLQNPIDTSGLVLPD